ncbi:MAG: hypothetical protein K6F96_05440 [Bacteroidales bacterium]|nr:hypothetical protein [Bacteroidales bacterium]
MGFKLNHSVAQRQFKKRIGQANHFLITILIGLDEVSKGQVNKPDTLDVCWNPKDVKVSVARSRAYALNSTLAWIIDNFDSYVQNCKRKPCLIENKQLSEELDSADRRVNDKFKVLFSRYKSNEELKLFGALVALGIQWRNVTTHSEANNILDDEYEEILLDNKQWYNENFCHLDVDTALESFKTHKNPTLKETTSIIKAVLRFVEQIDTELLKEIQGERFLTELIEKHFSQGRKSKCLFLNLSKERQIAEVKNVLLNNGYIHSNDEEGFEVDETFVDRYIAKQNC